MHYCVHIVYFCMICVRCAFLGVYVVCTKPMWYNTSTPYTSPTHPHRNDLWQDEEFEGARHSAQPGFVDVDAHVMSNPVFADLDGDGVEELIVAASFFYDKDYYDAPVCGVGVGLYCGYIVDGCVVDDVYL